MLVTMPFTQVVVAVATQFAVEAKGRVDGAEDEDPHAVKLATARIPNPIF
jgi:hypothetical protein